MAVYLAQSMAESLVYSMADLKDDTMAAMTADTWVGLRVERLDLSKVELTE